MSGILGTATVAANKSEDFNELLERAILRFQQQGAVVEVQYRPGSEFYTRFTAVVVARRSN